MLRLHFCVLCFVALAADFGAPALEQPRPAQTKPLSFETSVIKPSQDGERNLEEFLPDGFLVRNDVLCRIIASAYYNLLEIPNHPVRNAPDWVRNENMDLTGKVSPEDAAAWQRETASLTVNSPTFKSALLELLVERYHLKAHTVPMEMDGFALVLERPGDKTKLVALKDAPAPDDSLQSTDKSGIDFTPTGVVFRMDRKPLEQLARSMGSMTGFLIEDRTGLAGTYSFTVRDRLPVHPTPEEHEDYRLPTQRWDLHSFGLKVVRAKVHTTALVIDHVERPTPN